MFHKFGGFAFKEFVRSSRRSIYQEHIRRTSLLVLGGGVLVGHSYLRKSYVSQTIYNDVLKPNKEGDTFEMGLYIASQKNLRMSELKAKEDDIQTTQNFLLRHLKILRILINDASEPFYTFLRFLELSLLFLPVLALYPITLLGKKIRHEEGGDYETKGSLIWYFLLRHALELAGPSFIKLGQWAGSRTDMFSHGLCDELGNLHSNARPHSTKYTKDKICESLDCDNLDDVFDEFQDKPLGVGAIAQVHLAKFSNKYIEEHLKEEFEDKTNISFNSWYAIKVVHPHARIQIQRDLKIMKIIANSINMIPTMEWLSLPAEVDQFSLLMNLQLDLRIECQNLVKFNHNFRNAINVKFPSTFEKVSNKDVLFEEYIHAFPMQNFLKVQNQLNNDELCKNVSDTFIDAFLQMLILDNFVHADLHPGNVMINFIRTNHYETKVLSDEAESYKIVDILKKQYNEKDPSFIDTLRQTLEEYTPQICFIDAGLVTELNSKNRVDFIDLFNALARFNGYKAGELMIERSKTPETAIDKNEFALKVKKLVDQVKKRTFTLGTVSIGDLLDQMLTMVRKHHVRLEGEFVSVVVAILLLEGIGRQLDPELDLFESSIPILREYSVQREASSLLHNTSTFSLLALWIGLELRQLMSSSVKQLYYLIKTDQLCPNY